MLTLGSKKNSTNYGYQNTSLIKYFRNTIHYNLIFITIFPNKLKNKFLTFFREDVTLGNCRMTGENLRKFARCYLETMTVFY